MQFILSRIITFIAVLLVILGLSQVPSVEKPTAPISYNSPKSSSTTLEIFKNSTEASSNPKPSEETIPKFPSEPVSTKNIESLPSKVEIPASLPLPSIKDLSIPSLNTKVRQSVVNILCSTLFGNPLKAVTGTGVVIDPGGVVLTNAHIAQYYLLETLNGQKYIDCTIRTGSPAYPAYRGKLLYISSRWVEDNKDNLNVEKPLGTGENDFGFILITEKSDGSPLSSDLPALEVATDDSDVDRTSKVSHIVAAYPAGFLGFEAVEKELYMASAVSYIKEVFTFKTTSIDLISLGGTVVAQRGASGGAVVSSRSDKLVGLIVTTSDALTTEDRDLRAITLSHINRSIKEETGSDISDYLSGDLKQKQVNFGNNTFPYLSRLIQSNIRVEN